MTAEGSQVIITGPDATLVVLTGADPSVEVVPSQTTKVVATGSIGPRGEPGVPGAPGAVGGQYVHTQNLASTTWTIVHNLNMHPNVTVVDSANTEVVGMVHYDDENTVTLTFSAAFSGYAYLS